MFIIYLLLVFILLIYNVSGIYLIIPFILVFLNFIVATWNLIGDPQNIFFRLVQLISLAFLIYIIILNIKLLIFGNGLYKMAFLIPLSINKITFLDDIFSEEQNNICYISKAYITRFYFSDSKEIRNFLDNLDCNKAYIVSFDLIYSWLIYEIGEPSLILSKPILISKESNSQLISNFIKERISLACDAYDLDENGIFIDSDGPGILVKFREIELFWK